MIIEPLPELQAELTAALERTGAVDLLDRLGRFSPSDREHCERVGQTAMALTQRTLNVLPLAIAAGFAGSLHDVGKADRRVQRIINQARRLTSEESAEVRERHTILGASMIHRLDFQEGDADLINEAAVAALFHHCEPGQLLSLPEPTNVTRIIQIADRFDAMQDASRPYHPRGMSPTTAVVRIQAALEQDGAKDYIARMVLTQMYNNLGHIGSVFALQEIEAMS